MKQIINGKLYDTETADLIGEWDNGHFTSDFHYCSESLYKTKKGAYFLHGDGGALSSYARVSGNNRCGGEEIVPLAEKAAREWAEHLSGAEYLEAFEAEEA